jgi:hypothetical protein
MYNFNFLRCTNGTSGRLHYNAKSFPLNPGYTPTDHGVTQVGCVVCLVFYDPIEHKQERDTQ